jgi:hypothetical protein
MSLVSALMHSNSQGLFGDQRRISFRFEAPHSFIGRLDCFLSHEFPLQLVVEDYFS